MDMLKNPVADPVVMKHLRKVYTALGAVTFAATAGCALQLRLGWQSTWMSTLMIMGSLFTFAFMSPRSPYRYAAFLLVGFLQGFSIGPLINLAFHVNPAIPLVAMAGAAAVFFSLTLAAMLAKRRAYLFLGGFLGSGLLVLSAMSLLSLFFGRFGESLVSVQIYSGLMLFCGYVLYDTQIIMEKARAGDRDDPLKHALELFQDLISIFVRLIIILIRNNQRREEDERRKRNRD